MLKNKTLLALVLVSVFFMGCDQSPPYDEKRSNNLDSLAIESYKVANVQELVVDPSGLNYQIVTPGAGTVHPTATDEVEVFFQANILGVASPFQSVPESAPVAVKLGEAIEGWKIGLPKITTGGKIRLVIPSALGYKDFSTSGLPAYSILDYTITLVNIK